MDNLIISDIYEHDFYAWSVKNAELIRQGRWEEIDQENVAEELEYMGRREKRELVSRLAVLLAHLLKWQFKPERQSNSWKYTIENQREEVSELLEDSPSLRYEIEDRLAKAYKKALRTAARETGIRKSSFPETCPFSFEETLDDNFFPEQS
ncbi:MAG: hypothetical protein B6245_15555 [Desulfobacteraceae bacterium 4572_88]|nr:MAG: hypothetical protein B6245_15555 [Desulfobacteraceae bacterium 4572_88]RLC08177.1 MAG: DUF29 domain-containing protein [Deltaproteobacteria bacterium]